MGQVTQTLTWRTEVGDVRPRAFFIKPEHYANIHYHDYTATYFMNGARTLKIHQEGAAPGLEVNPLELDVPGGIRCLLQQ